MPIMRLPAGQWVVFAPISRIRLVLGPVSSRSGGGAAAAARASSARTASNAAKSAALREFFGRPRKFPRERRVHEP
jgi:hypothetical protein